MGILHPSDNFQIHKPTVYELKVMRETVAKMITGNGLGVDEGIVEAVVTLNAIGLCTDSSCEGHNPRHSERVSALGQRPGHEYSCPNLGINADTSHSVDQEKILWELLKEFYEGRSQVAELYRIIPQRMSPHYIQLTNRIVLHRTSHAPSYFHAHQVPLENDLVYEACKAEMDAFVHFLQEKYFPETEQTHEENDVVAPHIEAMKESVQRWAEVFKRYSIN